MGECPFKVYDVIRPKEPDSYEQAYEVRYRVKKVYGSYIIAEPLIRPEHVEEICDSIKKEIYSLNCTLPSFVSIDAKVSVTKRIYIWDFEWEDYEVVDDGSTV